MRLPINRPPVLKSLLLLVLSVAITVMIAPNLNLVPARYAAGDIITETILLADNVNLVDEQSTEARRSQAIDNFLPIYDFDARLAETTRQNVTAVFESMRKTQSNLRKAVTEAEGRVRQNSVERAGTGAAQTQAQRRRATLERLKTYTVAELGRLGDQEKPTPKQQAQAEKVRFDLLAVEAQITAAEQTLIQLSTRLEQLRSEGETLRTAAAQARLDEQQGLARLKSDLEGGLGVTLDDATFSALSDAQFNRDVEQRVLSLVLPFFDSRIVASRETLSGKDRGIQIKGLQADQLERFEALDTILEVPQVRAQINARGQEMKMPPDSAPYREAIITVAQRLVRPNLTENKGETERLRQDLLRTLSPVYFNLKKGDVVARAGDVATPQQVEIIRALQAYYLKNPKYPQIVGSFLIVLLTLLVVYRLISLRSRAQEVRFRRLLLMAILILGPLLITQSMLQVVPALTTIYQFVPAATYTYLLPAALTSMLASILLGFQVALYLGFAQSIFVAILLGSSLPVFLFTMLGSVVAAVPLRHYDTRYALWQQGLRISGMNLTVLIVLSLLAQRELGVHLTLDLGAAVINGLLVAFLTATFLPLLEKFFDITTSLRLLELSNMNHPALKELSVRAPGTYHHSIVVGNLSESAAEGIRANPLLVRVASYYHDLGKMLCPLYFVENQTTRNYHDDLPAKTSARIIINHVKDGLELARRYKLGRTITDIIAQHHGSSLVRYFFHKAQEEEGDPQDELAREEFCYPGPKPQTKEAGLVMVADVTEAATRSLGDPSPEKIREMVQKLTTRIYMEGQLDESSMTFNDLNFIEKTFTKMLLSIHHHRIAYPDQQGPGRAVPLRNDPNYDQDLLDEQRAASGD